MKTDGSIFLASACASAFFRIADKLASWRVKTGTDA
jgi:hypothetical protein